jgi:predicted nucleic acid-binding protein
MEQTPFELTPEQKGILATLSRETGKSIPALLAEALEVLQEHERFNQQHDNVPSTSSSATRSSAVLEIFREASEGIPEEVWKALPEDLAAQHDHYIYGTPKRSLWDACLPMRSIGLPFCMRVTSGIDGWLRSPRRLSDYHLYTTDTVFDEYLAAYGAREAYLRQRAAATVRRLLASPEVTVIHQTRELFLEGLTLYEARPDKAYSLTDCISMQTMRREGLTEVLTNDHHFTQEGFHILFP